MNGNIRHVKKTMDFDKDSYYYELANNERYEKFRNLANSQPTIGDKYYELHTKNLIKTNIKIDLDLFCKEINDYTHLFEKWGIKHTDILRSTLSLTKTNVKVPKVKPNPANWPMDVWCIEYPDTPLLDTSFTEPNDVFMSMQSLKDLMIFKDHFARCNILKWDAGGKFFPHIDVKYPFHNLRLWGTNDPDNYHFCFWNEEKKEYIREENVEAGRIYIASTEKWHHAYSTADNNYTFFIALQVSAFDLLKKHVL